MQSIVRRSRRGDGRAKANYLERQQGKGGDNYLLRSGKIKWKITKENKTKIGFFSTKNMQTPSPLNFYQVLMEDAQYAETNEKSIFRFLFFDLSWKFIENWGDFWYKNDHNTKNKN